MKKLILISAACLFFLQSYACEWTPTEINTYYDGKLVRHIEWPNPAEFDPMNIYLDIEGSFSANGNHHRCNPCNSNTQFPFYYDIDYVKVFKLKTAGCTNDIYISSNYNWSSYTYSLKKTITANLNNNQSYHTVVGGGANVSLRAVDYILLNDGFEVDDNINTEFFATVNGTCDN